MWRSRTLPSFVRPIQSPSMRHQWGHDTMAAWEEGISVGEDTSVGEDILAGAVTPAAVDTASSSQRASCIARVPRTPEAVSLPIAALAWSSPAPR